MAASPAMSPPDTLLRRSALGLWFCAIAAVGLLQFYARAFDDGRFEPGAIAWIWLGGGIVLGAIGLTLLVRAWRRRGDAAGQGRR